MSNQLIRQILRFGVVGGLAFVIDFSLLIFLTEIVGWNYLISATCSFLVSNFVNYILSICWVFNRAKKRQGWQKVWQLILFTSLSTCGLGINNLIMWLTVEIFGGHYVLGKFIATFVVMVFNFITRKIMLERKAARKAETVSEQTVDHAESK